MRHGFKDPFEWSNVVSEESVSCEQTESPGSLTPTSSGRERTVPASQVDDDCDVDLDDEGPLKLYCSTVEP